MWANSLEVSEFYDANQIEFVTDRKSIVIGHDVWIGSRATIMAGVKVGTGAVVAAGAIVTKDVQPYTIVAGVPAKIIRSRFDADTVERLLNSAWWTINPLLMKGLDYSNVPMMLDKIDEIKSGKNWLYQPHQVTIPTSY